MLVRFSIAVQLATTLIMRKVAWCILYQNFEINLPTFFVSISWFFVYATPVCNQASRKSMKSLSFPCSNFLPPNWLHYWSLVSVVIRLVLRVLPPNSNRKTPGNQFISSLSLLLLYLPYHLLTLRCWPSSPYPACSLQLWPCLQEIRRQSGLTSITMISVGLLNLVPLRTTICHRDPSSYQLQQQHSRISSLVEWFCLVAFSCYLHHLPVSLLEMRIHSLLFWPHLQWICPWTAFRRWKQQQINP